MLQELFATDKPVIGTIHLLPLPGSHRFAGNVEAICERAEQEAAAFTSGGAHGLIVENFFDAPFAKNHVDTATACAMAIVTKRIMSITSIPVGINVLRNDALTAVSVAVTTGAKFIRVNVYTGAMLTDQGVIEGCAHELLNYRRLLGADHEVRIFADVMVKHAAPLSDAITIGQAAAETVQRGMADAVIVSGTMTGSAPEMADIHAIRQAVPKTPLIIGSGTTKDNVSSYLSAADGVIVASSLKRQGQIENPVDVERVRAFVAATKAAARVK
jgi:membrane complex biogenesis BtpA family protein